MEKLLYKFKKYIPKKIFSALQPIYHFLLSALAAVWYNFPSNKLIVIGVTGTTGKTSSVYLIAKMLASAGYKTGFTSTAIFNDGKNEWLNDKKMTMVGRFFTQKILKKMVKNNCQYAIVETTSQGIEQFRHCFINYDILIFTGLHSEHIEAHNGFENYKQAKGKLFAHLKQCKTKYTDDKKNIVETENNFKKISANKVKKIIITNGDDEHSDFFLSFWAEEKWIYANKNITNSKYKTIKYDKIASNKNGVEFVVENKTKINLELLGEYNATNAMTAVCLGLTQNINIENIKYGLEKNKTIPGHMEIIKNEKPKFTIIIDYAFEPKALRKAYDAILKLEHTKIIHVLGACGGGRDTARRPELGVLAGENADFVIITNEDPYDDDPKIIIDQVAEGTKNTGKILEKDLFKILDRRKAIKKALSLAGENDIVLITGKGCEQAICGPAGAKIPWDDRKIVKEELFFINATNLK